MSEPKEELLQVVCVLIRTKKKRRKANDELEAWVERSLIQLWKAERFSERDQEFANSITEQLHATHKLTEAQWVHARKLADRYGRYIAPPPDPRQADLFGDKPK